MANLFKQLKKKGFDVLTLHHAEAILLKDMNDAEKEIEDVLLSLKLPIKQLISGGGGEANITQDMRHKLDERRWKKHNFEIKKTIDGRVTESQSHEIDHVRTFGDYKCALEIEWNNKDPFFDRDLENFKRLHAEGAISVGIIITRGQSLQSSLKTIISNYAKKMNFGSIEDIREDMKNADIGKGGKSGKYNPTIRQQEMIANRVEQAGFAEGWASQFVSDKFGQATTHWGKLEDRVKRGVGNPCPLVLIGLPAILVEG